MGWRGLPLRLSPPDAVSPSRPTTRLASQVRGTVRSLSSERARAAAAACGEGLELYAADLLEPGSWAEVMKGATHVFHTASPFKLVVNDVQGELIDPAVKGTMAVLRAADAAGTVRRVVMTSSGAAVSDKSKLSEPGYVFSEKDWNTTSSHDVEPYRYSKTLAERAAWEFAAGKAWRLCTICPAYVFGPVLSAAADSTSVLDTKALIDGTYAPPKRAPKGASGVVDVRDVAEAHLAVAESESAEGRYLMSSPEDVTFLERARLIAAAGCSELAGLPLPTEEAAPTTARRRYDCRKVEAMLGRPLLPPERVMPDTARSMLEVGLVKRNT